MRGTLVGKGAETGQMASVDDVWTVTPLREACNQEPLLRRLDLRLEAEPGSERTQPPCKSQSRSNVANRMPP
ncbi:hypothetical protein APR04_005139 [Promicromonospora umidemergens]|uniref:Uncharacterized protein n=1 Tax=Promicromonospora umidemergens TaxID=629679 RepID=A0ABP8XU41_9MICO|nr:hypothetical protein [Promicromonospora umidemergens]